MLLTINQLQTLYDIDGDEKLYPYVLLKVEDEPFSNSNLWWSRTQKQKINLQIAKSSYQPWYVEASLARRYTVLSL